MAVFVTGVQRALRNLTKVQEFDSKAAASAIAKVSEESRGHVRRFLVSSEGITLKSTRKRVQWFWKDKPHKGQFPKVQTKVWVGTRYPVTAKEVKALVGRKPVDLGEKEEAIRAVINRVIKTRFATLYKSQLRRFLIPLR